MLKAPVYSPKILAIDVCYKEDRAYIAELPLTKLVMKNPESLLFDFRGIKNTNPVPFTNGNSCILKLLEEHKLNPELIIVDGFVYLDQKSKMGLGAYLWQNLADRGLETKVIGVAKNPRKDIYDRQKVLRGDCRKHFTLMRKEFPKSMATLYRTWLVRIEFRKF